MKSLGKLKLNQLSKNELDQRKMNALKGGCGCEDYCVCRKPDYSDDSGGINNGNGEYAY